VIIAMKHNYFRIKNLSLGILCVSMFCAKDINCGKYLIENSFKKMLVIFLSKSSFKTGKHMCCS